MTVLMLMIGVGVFISLSEGSVTITVPTAGNCGEDTVLTCYVIGSIGSTAWYGLNRTLVLGGNPVRKEDNNKYTETRGASSAILTIHNTNIIDEGDYRCRNSNNWSQLVTLNFQCKASAGELTVTDGKKVVITVDKLYPADPTLTASFTEEKNTLNVPGSSKCSNSTQFTGYYKCVWTSNSSLADGSYTCSLVVTAITQTDPGKTSFKIVSPLQPAILNIVKLEDSREVIYGNESQSLTIQCTSMGGFPAPTLVWYKDSLSSSHQMASTNTGTLLDDFTYNVTLQHNFIPSASDDRKALFCRSYYPQADSTYIGSKSKAVILYLALKPHQPTAIQTSVVSTEGIVEVSCRTSGGRPAANISWSYQGSTTTGETTSMLDASTETYTVESFFRRQVTAEDNGRLVRCTVTHPALVSPSQRTTSIKLNIYLKPSQPTVIQTAVVSTGDTVEVSCRTTDCVPAANIFWLYQGSASTGDVTATLDAATETYTVVSVFRRKVTAADNGRNVQCVVTHPALASPLERTASIKLNVRYSPLVTIQGQQQNTVTEGESKQLSCKVNSIPQATFKWYHGSSLVFQGTPSSNILNYSVTPVNRTHYGTYSCKASNGIGMEQQEQISITVRFKPLTTAITGNSNIIANGKNTLPLVCTSGSSNPISDITWRINDVITPHTGNISDQSGNYGGMKRRQRLMLTPTRDHDGDIYMYMSCEANNSIGTSERSKVTLDLRYCPLIEPMSQVIAVEGNNTVLTCAASSKPASAFRWYRVGQNSMLSQGTGTLHSNKWSYTINNARRTDAATNRCNANNGVETAANGNIFLIVYHPPDVTAVTTNTTVKAATASITSIARGVPNSNYKYGKWIQTWPGSNIHVSEIPGSERLVLSHLTYEHSGLYTCSASNGIKVFGSNKEFMDESVYLLVKSYPIITQLAVETPARLKKNATIEVHYYSNVEGSGVKIYRNVTGARQAGDMYTISEDYAEVDLPVFSRIIKTDGTRARILIQILSKEDFGFYDVVVSNKIDSSSQTFEIVPIGPPSGPFNITVDNIQQNTARVSWTRGFHGGFVQTFSIHLSADKTHWTNEETVYGGTNGSEEPMYKLLTNLESSTIYYVRMYAFNSEGNSTFSESHNFTTLSEVTDNSLAVTEGAVGGIISALIVIVVIVLLIVLVRRGSITKDSLRTSVQTAIVCVRKNQKEESEVETDGQENSIRMYEHLQHTTDSGKANDYDALKVDHGATGNRKTEQNVNQTYENLKLRSEITGGK